MARTVLTIDGRREGYAIDQITNTLTVGQLIEYLEDCDPEMPVMINNDDGYTYGSITYTSFREEEE